MLDCVCLCVCLFVCLFVCVCVWFRYRPVLMPSPGEQFWLKIDYQDTFLQKVTAELFIEVRSSKPGWLLTCISVDDVDKVNLLVF